MPVAKQWHQTKVKLFDNANRGNMHKTLLCTSKIRKINVSNQARCIHLTVQATLNTHKTNNHHRGRKCFYQHISWIEINKCKHEKIPSIYFFQLFLVTTDIPLHVVPSHLCGSLTKPHQELEHFTRKVMIMAL